MRSRTCDCPCHKGAMLIHVVPCCESPVAAAMTSMFPPSAPRLTVVIAGGQTGVDQAALRAARDAGLHTSGWCPPICESDDGPIPPEFGLHPTPLDRSPDAPEVPRSQRTEWNVRDADATLILRPSNSMALDPGTDWATRCTARYGRLVLTLDPSDEESVAIISNWLRTQPVTTLNVAGPSERTAPGIGERAYALMKNVFVAIVLPTV